MLMMIPSRLSDQNRLPKKRSFSDWNLVSDLFRKLPFILFLILLSSVRLETVIRVGEGFLTFLDIMSTFQSVGQLFRSFTNWFQSQSTDIELIDFGDGSVCFTVQAKSLKGLTTLWERYKDGTLKESLYDFLVTHKVKQLAEAEEDVELTVTIDKEEYERACIDLKKEAKGN